MASMVEQAEVGVSSIANGARCSGRTEPTTSFNEWSFQFRHKVRAAKSFNIAEDMPMRNRESAWGLSLAYPEVGIGRRGVEHYDPSRQAQRRWRLEALMPTPPITTKRSMPSVCPRSATQAAVGAACARGLPDGVGETHCEGKGKSREHNAKGHMWNKGDGKGSRGNWPVQGRVLDFGNVSSMVQSWVLGLT